MGPGTAAAAVDTSRSWAGARTSRCDRGSHNSNRRQSCRLRSTARSCAPRADRM
jgi:hypothetical protein